MTRAEWFASLAGLAYPAGRERAEAAMVPFMPWFVDIPDAAFTRASLEAVINSPRKMAIPSYDEVRRPLAAWWRENRPAEQRLASEYPALSSRQKRQPPSEIEKHAVSQLVKGFMATTSVRRSHLVTPEAERPPAAYLADQQLLAQYEATANNATLPRGVREIAQTRVTAIRAKLGLDQRAEMDRSDEMEHAA